MADFPKLVGPPAYEICHSMIADMTVMDVI